jgi:hypothetical protein
MRHGHEFLVVADDGLFNVPLPKQPCRTPRIPPATMLGVATAASDSEAFFAD